MHLRLIVAALSCAPILSAGTIIITPNPITGTEAGSLNNIIVATFTDTSSPSLVNLSGTITWGDGTESAGTVTGNSGSYDLIGSHTYAEEGTFTFTASVDDSGDSTSGQNTGTATIADAPLTAGSPMNGTGFVGTEIESTLGSFTDANPFGTLIDFAATINWGDGTAPTAGTITQPGGPGTQFFVSGGHTYAVDGSYDLTIGINDVGGSTTTDTATEDIVPEPGTFLLCGAGILFGCAGLRLRGRGLLGNLLGRL